MSLSCSMLVLLLLLLLLLLSRLTDLYWSIFDFQTWISTVESVVGVVYFEFSILKGWILGSEAVPYCNLIVSQLLASQSLICSVSSDPSAELSLDQNEYYSRNDEGFILYWGEDLDYFLFILFDFRFIPFYDVVKSSTSSIQPSLHRTTSFLTSLIAFHCVGGIFQFSSSRHLSDIYIW